MIKAIKKNYKYAVACLLALIIAFTGFIGRLGGENFA